MSERELLNESLFYMIWALIFVVFSLIASTVSAIEAISNNIVSSLPTWAIGMTTLIISHRLKRKSLYFRQKADEK